MIDIVITEESGLQWVRLQGRIDSITAPDVEKCLNELVSSGQRMLVLDMRAIHYMSSLGLRVMLAAQKQLKKADGEIMICQPTIPVLELFEMSGFKMLFRIFSTREELQAELAGDSNSTREERIEISGIELRCIRKTVEFGSLSVIGTQEKLAGSRYEVSDVSTVKAADIQFGAGLASLGDSFDEYRLFFGEAVVLNHSLFFYPAVKRPAVDFMLCTQAQTNIEYRFLHGFSIAGSFSHLFSFESIEHPVELDRLSQVLGQIIPGNLFGLVFLAESKGVWGMHLKQVPLAENRPANGKDIFDSQNFSTWMNFPVEPSDINHILAGVGLVVKNPDLEPRAVQELFAKGSRVHCHAGVFSMEPLSKKPDQFENELKRVIAELPVSKVQHLMGQSRFHHGMVGIIELENR
ncbi:MAG: STAS domain-containing protein [Deltaproteobacteria bacterium]|nr:STAS domain-containing protein [Deltaproteobacteria bacterium]